MTPGTIIIDRYAGCELREVLSESEWNRGAPEDAWRPERTAEGYLPALVLTGLDVGRYRNANHEGWRVATAAEVASALSLSARVAAGAVTI